MTNCPDCNRSLRENATRCACGWNAFDQKVIRAVDCAHVNCQNGAVAKVKTQSGWANLCMSHYDAFFKKKAIQSCLDRGLNSPEACRAWLKENRLKVHRFTDAEKAA